MKKVRPAAFLLIKTNTNAYGAVPSIRNEEYVRWASATYGPYQIVAYVDSEGRRELTDFIEGMRTREEIAELDARMCKPIPGDEELSGFEITKPESTVLLIGTNYREEKERIITYNLRELKGIKFARAMWGPADIIAVAEADDHESMRNLICDQVKIMKGVLSNITLYSYPEMS